MKDEAQLERLLAEASLIAALARSQNSLARILDSIADLSVDSDGMAKALRNNVHTLTAFQESMAEAVTCQAWRKRVIRHGKPQPPWLHFSVNCSCKCE